MSHSYSEISNTKLHRLWDIIPSSSIDVKVRHFISSGNGDTELILSSPNKTGITFLNTLVRDNIEESTSTLYPLNYGEDIFNPSPWIRGKI